jgi:hypothetical protein
VLSPAGRPDPGNGIGRSVGLGEAEGDMREKRKNGKVKMQEV